MREISEGIHDKLNKGSVNLTNDEFYLDPQVIDIHVELLEKSTAGDYLTFMQKINNNEFFDNKTLDTIKLLFDQVDKVSNYSSANFIHVGAKGGSANYPGMINTALAVAGYAEMNDNIKTSYAIIFNNMNTDTFAERLQDYNLFILALETSEFYVLEFIKRMGAKS